MDTLKLPLVLFLVLFLQGCCLFGRTTTVHDRMPFIKGPEAPQLQPDDGTVERWQENYSKVATFAVRSYRGIQAYNEIALKHNIEHGYVKEDEVEDVRKLYRIPKPPDPPPEE